MKKIELTTTKENGIDAIRYELLGNEEYDERIQDKINQLSNVLPYEFSNQDGKRIITTYVRDTYSLEMLLSKILQKREVLCLLSELASVYDIGTHGVPVSYVVKDFNHIYVNEETFTVKCILVPVKQEAISLNEIPAFFRDVVSRMSFDEIDMDNYVAKILTIINSNDFSTSKLKTYIDEELEKLGLFISKEKGLVSVNAGGQGTQTKDVKVNRLGVINNMQNAQPPMMGQPPQGSVPPIPQQGQIPQGVRPNTPPMMGQPPQGSVPPVPQQGQIPQGVRPNTPPMMGRPPQGNVPPMPQQGQIPQGVRPNTPPMMGQPPQGNVPPMPQQGQAPQGNVPPMSQQGQIPQGVRPNTPPMMGQPPQGSVPPVPQQGQIPQGVRPNTPPMMGQPPQGNVPPMPQQGQIPQGVRPNNVPPMMGQPNINQNIPQQPKNEDVKVEAEDKVESKVEEPKPIEVPKTKEEEPKSVEIPEVKEKESTPIPTSTPVQSASSSTQTPVQPAPMPTPPSAPTMMGGLAGQLGEKPIPHLVRKKTGEIINITKPEFSIGKSQTNADYTIEENPAISRVHCIIVQKNGVNYIKDNNSTNHTYINGEEIEPEKEILLKHKTAIKMGDEEFTFLLRKE